MPVIDCLSPTPLWPRLSVGVSAGRVFGHTPMSYFYRYLGWTCETFYWDITEPPRYCPPQKRRLRFGLRLRSRWPGCAARRLPAVRSFVLTLFHSYWLWLVFARPIR